MAIINAGSAGGGGAVYPEIIVTAPAGSAVTVTDGVHTYTHTATGSPVVQVVHNYGTWTVTATNGTDTVSKTVEVHIVEEYTVVLSYFSATINVTYRAGLVCTCTIGATVLTAPDTSGTASFEITQAGDWVVSTTDDTWGTKSETVSITASGQTKAVDISYIVYGFKIEKADSNPATRVHYMYDNEEFTPLTVDLSTGAPNYGSWADSWFITGNKPCMQLYDGTIDYYLDPNDYTKKLDGTASDIANTSYGGNGMAVFQRVWFHLYEDTTYEYAIISNKKLSNDFQAFGCERSDDSIMDYFTRSLFDGANVSSKIRSLDNQTPSNTTAGGTQLSYVRANGSLWFADTWSRITYIWILLILIGRSTDVQATFGYGADEGMSGAGNLFKTGRGKTFGQFYGRAGNTNNVVKVFHVEFLWSNLWKLVEGLIYESGFKTKMKPPYSDTGSDYTATGVVLGGTSGGYISAQKMSMDGWLPKTVSGSDSTYTPDGCWWTSGQMYGRVGSGGADGLHCGFAVAVLNALSSSYWNVGVALSCEQPSS